MPQGQFISPRAAYWLQIAMLTIAMVIGSVTFTDYVDAKTGKLILQILVIAYGVIGVVTNGAIPPAPTPGQWPAPPKLPASDTVGKVG